MNSKNTKKVIKVTPWYNKAEFFRVKEALFSNDICDAIWGLQKLEVWRQKAYPVLPAAIECTSYLIRAKVEDELAEKGMCVMGDYKGLTLLYEAAINKFVNLMTEIVTSPEASSNMKKAAHKLGLPDWIVDLRHKATHSNSPPLEMLQNGANYIYDWLRDKYWNQIFSDDEKEEEPVFSIPESPKYLSDENEINELIRKYKEHQCEILYGSIGSLSKRKLKNILEFIRQRLMNNKEKFFNILLKPDKFFIPITVLGNILPPEDVDYLINTESLILPESLVEFWAPLIEVINSCNCIQNFIHHLVTTYHILEKIDKKIACGWALKIIRIAATSGASELSTDPICKIFEKKFWILNWLECTSDAIFNPSAYTSPIFQEAVEHIYPPFSEEKKASLATIFSVYIGAIPPELEEYTKKKNRLSSPYKWEQLQENIDLKDIAEGSSTLTSSKVIWKHAPSDINWAELPLGHVFGSVNDFIGYPSSVKKAMEEDMENSENDIIPVKTTQRRRSHSTKSVLNDNYEMNTDYVMERFEIEMNVSEDPSVSFNEFF